MATITLAGALKRLEALGNSKMLADDTNHLALWGTENIDARLHAFGNQLDRSHEQYYP